MCVCVCEREGLKETLSVCEIESVLMFIYVRVRVCVRESVCVCVTVSVYVCDCECVCVWLWVCMWERKRERKREKREREGCLFLFLCEFSFKSIPCFNFFAQMTAGQKFLVDELQKNKKIRKSLDIVTKHNFSQKK